MVKQKIAPLVARQPGNLIIPTMEKSKKPKILPVHEAEAALLKKLFDERSTLSQAEFGAEYEIGSQGMVWQYLNARSPLNLSAALKFAKGLKCEIREFSLRLWSDWLLMAPPSSDELSPSSNTAPENTMAYLSPKDDNIEIRQFESGGSMGAGVLLRDQPGVIASWRVSPEWLQKNVRHHSGAQNLCVVTGFGDSMRPLYEPGDPLLVDTGIKAVDFDGIYFFRVGDEGFIKRLQRIPGQGIVAISENKAYRDWTITGDMDFQVFGRIVKAWKSEDY